MTPAEDFFKVNPPSRLDFRSLRPPLPREFPESHPSEGCGFFLEQPNEGNIENQRRSNSLNVNLILTYNMYLSITAMHYPKINFAGAQNQFLVLTFCS